MELLEINAEARDDVGKGASRRLRKTGRVPGIVYGTKKEVCPITLTHDELIHHLEHEAFYSSILTLTVGGASEKVVLKDLQRHPVKPSIMHIDFQRIDEKEKLTMRVPLHFINEDKCIGVKRSGGEISHIMTDLEITCLPADLPEFIEIDLENLDIGDSIHLGDLKVPEGVEITSLLRGGAPDQSVASVHMPRVEEEEGAQELEGLAAAAPAAVPDAAGSEDTEES